MEIFKNHTCDNCDTTNVTTFGLADFGMGSVLEFCAPCMAATTKCRVCHTNQAMEPVDNRAPWEVKVTYDAICNECWTAQLKADLEAHATQAEPDWDGMAQDYWDSRNDGPVD